MPPKTRADTCRRVHSIVHAARNGLHAHVLTPRPMEVAVPTDRGQCEALALGGRAVQHLQAPAHPACVQSHSLESFSVAAGRGEVHLGLHLHPEHWPRSHRLASIVAVGLHRCQHLSSKYAN
jgi:hypothetical protein